MIRKKRWYIFRNLNVVWRNSFVCWQRIALTGMKHVELKKMKMFCKFFFVFSFFCFYKMCFHNKWCVIPWLLHMILIRLLYKSNFCREKVLHFLVDFVKLNWMRINKSFSHAQYLKTICSLTKHENLKNCYRFYIQTQKFIPEFISNNCW